ncbi:MAG: hypothetical protein LBM18_01980 [Oscillospiraceae bacterium]|jgi:ribosomal protein L14E/L6E/L27E|nr:hypothetical protein [Oscillospiraceae bacterium]
MTPGETKKIVFSLAGHDKGGAFILLEEDDKSATLADGKTRTLSKPKKKSLKHISTAGEASALFSQSLFRGEATDAAVRKELARFRAQAEGQKAPSRTCGGGY